MKKQYAVLGLSSLGISMAVTLQKLGAEVIVVDIDEEKIEDIADKVSSAMIADAGDIDVLKTLGVKNFDGIIVSIEDELEACVLATLNLKELGAPYVMAVAKDETYGKVLKKVGADRVIFPEQEIGERLARNMVSGSFHDWIALSDEYSVLEIPVPESWVGRSLTDINVRKNYHVNVIALRHDEKIDCTMDTAKPFEADERLIIVGANALLEKIK